MSDEVTGVRPGVLAAGLQALVPDIKQEDDISSSDLLPACSQEPPHRCSPSSHW